MDARLRHFCAAALALFALRCLLFAWLAPFPIPFDEHAHLSYVLYVHASGDWMPSFDDMHLVDPDSFGDWTDDLNYLDHPSPYYVALSWLAGLQPGSDEGLVLVLRTANVLLAVLAMAIVIGLGLRMALTQPARIAYVVLVVTVPTLPVLGGIISNDNLAFLGGAVCCAGAYALLAGDRSGGAVVALAGGFALAAAAKLTAALLCGTLALTTLGWILRRDGMAVALPRRSAAFGLVVACLALLPYLDLWNQYGSPAPLTEGQAAKIESRLEDFPAWRDMRYTFAGYLMHFGASLLLYWPPAPPTSPVELVLLAIPAFCLAAAVGGMGYAFAALRRTRNDATAAFVLCGTLALSTVLAIHVGFTFERHLETGWQRGIYPRYYFPLLPVLPASCALLASRVRWPTAGAWLAGVLVCLAILYDALQGLPVIA